MCRYGFDRADCRVKTDDFRCDLSNWAIGNCCRALGYGVDLSRVDGRCCECLCGRGK